MRTALHVLIGACLMSGAVSGQAVNDVWHGDLGSEEVHPCLMFGFEDIPQIRQRLSLKPYAGWWAGVQASSDMVCQAFTWLMTADDTKAAAVRQRLLQANPTGYHCSCGVATALQGCAEAYDLIYHYEGLSKVDHRIIRRKIADACERMHLSALESGAGQHPGNQRTRGICALGTAAIVLRGYGDAAHTPAEWLQRALDGIHQEANLMFWRDDGMFIEGPGYSSFTLSIMLPFARYYEQATGSWLFDEPRLRNALLYLIRITQPDGKCAAIGTTNSGNIVNTLRLCIGAGDPRVQAFCRWAIEEWGSLSGGGVRDIGLFDADVEPGTAGFSTTRFYPVTQEAHIRSEWSRNAVALWFKGKDPWLARTHRVYSHGDVGSFVLHAYGEVLAVDAGYDHWVSYNLYPPQLHNTLLVDGEGPVNETPGLLENALDVGFLQGGDIVSEYRGIRHRRSFAVIDGLYVIITDGIEADESHEYAWQIHTPVSRAGGRVAVEGNRASWQGFDPQADAPGQVGVEAVWAGPVTIQPMETSRWQPFSSSPTSGSYDNWALAAKQTGKNARYLTVLYPHPVRLPSATIETPRVQGAHCITVKTGPVTDTILALEDGSASFGSIATTARSCVVREQHGELVWFCLWGPGTLDYEAGRIAEASAPAGACMAGKVLTRAGKTEIVLVPAGVHGAGTAPPRVRAVTVDGRQLPVRERVDVGRLPRAPDSVSAQFVAEPPGAGLAPGTLRVTLDGVAVPVGQVSWEDGRVSVRPGAVSGDGTHELVMRVAGQGAPPNWGQFLLAFSTGPLLVNGGFERGGSKPHGWGLGTWSADAQTEYESRAVRDRPHSGQWCLMVKGIAGGLNLVASQHVDVERGKTYVLRGYCRGDVAAKASFCSQSGKNQYIWSPPLGPSEDWTPFEWVFTVENPEERLIIAMRLGDCGTVYFDDLSLEEKAPAVE